MSCQTNTDQRGQLLLFPCLASDAWIPGRLGEWTRLDIYVLKTPNTHREREMGHTDAFRTGAYVTLQDEGQDVEELQLSVLHVCLDVLAHQGPAGGIARVSAARLSASRLLWNDGRRRCWRWHGCRWGWGRVT